MAEASFRDLLFLISLLIVPAVVMALVSGLAHKSTSSKERGFESLSCHQFFAPRYFRLSSCSDDEQCDIEKAASQKEDPQHFIGGL